jgi:hypothetical protein
VERKDDTLVFTAEGNTKAYSILLRNVSSLESIENGSYESHDLGIIISPEVGDRPVTVKL